MRRYPFIGAVVSSFMIVFMIIGINGCMAPISRHSVKSGRVVKITSNQNYYNILIENKGEIVTQHFNYFNVTFIQDLKEGESMRFELDSQENSHAIIHIRSVDDIIMVGSSK